MGYTPRQAEGSAQGVRRGWDMRARQGEESVQGVQRRLGPWLEAASANPRTYHGNPARKAARCVGGQRGPSRAGAMRRPLCCRKAGASLRRRRPQTARWGCTRACARCRGRKRWSRTSGTTECDTREHAHGWVWASGPPGHYVVDYRESITRVKHELPADSYGTRKTWGIITNPGSVKT